MRSMSLAPGKRLAHYEIVEPIGKGGMGEVYRAKDEKLGRQVAIKVLLDAFAQDAQRMARFEREARLLASVNHPNVATLHGFESSGDTRFLVMELVDGETLAERVARGPIPLVEALPLFIGIAEGLEAAHEKGVLHRDLKPANIKVGADGKPKILDFGLAKELEGGAEGSSSESPTMTAAATRSGVIMGTAAYMSPEQARGKLADKSSDVWAFGAVFYEMLTGKRAFEAEDISLTLAAVMTSEPDWDALPDEMSPTLRIFLMRCFVKDPRERVRDIGDVRLAMKGAFDTAPSRQGVDSHPVVWHSPKAVVVALALIAVTAFAVWMLVRSGPPPPRPVARFSLTLPPAVSLTSTDANVAISPDGTRLVYSANNQLYTRTMDQIEATPVRGTEGGAQQPFFSPDGEWVGFFTGYAGGQLKKVSVSGGAASNLCEAKLLFGAQWRADDTIIFGLGGAGILRVSAEGGTPEVLVPLDATTGEAAHGPQVLPGDKAVLFTLGSVGNWDNAKIAVHSLESGQTRILIERGRGARYVGTGHLLYALDETLWAAPFDVDNLEVTGSPVPMVNGVLTTGFAGGAHFSVSDAGSLVYLSSDLGERTLVWVDRQGNEEVLAAEPQAYGNPDLSPDGKHLALGISNDIWTYDLARSTFTRLSSGYGSAVAPRWSPDGRRIVFSSGREGIGINLFWTASDGTGEVERLTTSPGIRQGTAIKRRAAVL